MRWIPGFRHGGTTQLIVSSWLGSDHLGRVPVVDGSWEVTDQAEVRVPGALRLSVPAELSTSMAGGFDGRTNWVPTTPDHPLARWGQQLQVQVLVDGTLVHLGWYRITRTVKSTSVVNVEAVGLLRNLERARLVSPLTLDAGLWFGDIVRRVVGGVFPVRIAVADSGGWGSRSWDEDRLGALREIVDARPARMYVDESRTLVVASPWTDREPAQLTLHDGDGGTLIDIGGIADDRDPPNGYVVTATPEDTSIPPVTDWWGIPSGPAAWDGPYGRNPAFYRSPLLNPDRDSVRAVAQQMTLRAQRAAAQVDFEAVFDPRLEVGDVVHMRHRRRGVDAIGRIMTLRHAKKTTRGTVALR